jgi:hypothetical protein
MIDVTNADRANWALDAVSRFVADTGADTATDAITDLIGDMLHLARGRGLDTEVIIRDASEMMHSETKEDAEGEMELVQSAFHELLEEDGWLGSYVDSCITPNQRANSKGGVMRRGGNGSPTARG